jgi:rSAM/selenodomain-associated transferase 1
MHHDITAGALIVFLRLPEKGKVKTRIADVLGPEEALRIYNLLTTQTLETAASLTIPVYLFYDGGLPEDRNPSFTYQIQVQGDLGQKMMHALSYALHLHPKAVIIGSDCPAITPDLITEAFSKLEEADIVIGPAVDGGYYLLGCKKITPSLFHAIPWSTDDVLKQTMEKIRMENLSWHELPTLNDIDTAEDWKTYLEAKG